MTAVVPSQHNFAFGFGTRSLISLAALFNLEIALHRLCGVNV